MSFSEFKATLLSFQSDFETTAKFKVGAHWEFQLRSL